MLFFELQSQRTVWTMNHGQPCKLSGIPLPLLGIFLYYSYLFCCDLFPCLVKRLHSVTITLQCVAEKLFHPKWER